MSKAEQLRRLDEVHRETLMLVQKFSKEDFERKAPAASWTALDIFAHLASWNRQAREGLAESRPVPQCNGFVENEPRTLSKVMDEFRQSHDALASAFRRLPAGAESESILEHSVRHYQTHQNDLNVLIASFRPH